MGASPSGQPACRFSNLWVGAAAEYRQRSVPLSSLAHHLQFKHAPSSPSPEDALRCSAGPQDVAGVCSLLRHRHESLQLRSERRGFTFGPLFAPRGVLTRAASRMGCAIATSLLLQPRSYPLLSFRSFGVQRRAETKSPFMKMRTRDS